MDFKAGQIWKSILNKITILEVKPEGYILAKVEGSDWEKTGDWTSELLEFFIKRMEFELISEVA